MYQAFTKRRGLATMGVFAASALVLAGCASETESTSGETSTDSGSSAGVVELNLATVNNPQMVDMESLKGEFEAAYPDRPAYCEIKPVTPQGWVCCTVIAFSCPPASIKR